MLKVVFIKVNMMYSKGKDALKPLIFPIIEAVTPEDVEVTFYDERIEKLPDSFDADVVAFSVETFAARHAYELAARYKKEGVRIVMGGFHVSAMPDEVLEHADTVLIGDAEDTWPRYIEDVKNSCEKQRYKSENKCSLTPINNNARCFEGKKYLKLGMVQASRGCKFNCDFCSIKSLYPAGVRQKDIDEVMREVRCSREKLIFFIDDNLFLNEESARKLFEAIKPLRKRWACQISLEVAFKDDILTLMKESGCIMVLIGFESLNEENLKLMNKAANLRIKHYEDAIGNIYSHGIMIYGMFVLGYDYDTSDSIRETMDFALRNNLAVANFNPLMVLPGTPLYERMRSEGNLLFKKWWLDDNYRYGDAMFVPRSMSPQELSDGCRNARYTFNSYRNIFRRLWGAKVNHKGIINTVVFLLANLISRSEIRRKQGTGLGERR